jgi:hypothetical protein
MEDHVGKLTHRSNNIGDNVVFGTLLGESFGETNLAELGGCNNVLSTN